MVASWIPHLCLASLLATLQCLKVSCDFFPTYRNHFFSFTETSTEYSVVLDHELLESKDFLVAMQDSLHANTVGSLSSPSSILIQSAMHA